LFRRDLGAALASLTDPAACAVQRLTRLLHQRGANN